VLGLLFLLFVALPIAELWILIRLGQAVGFWLTLAIVLGTGALGAALAKSQGMRVLREVQSEITAGRMPHRQVLDGMAVLVGGTLLLTPGFISDVAGLALLFPPTRRLIQTLARRWFARQIEKGTVQVSVIDWQPGGGPAEPRPYGLDPSKEIRVPPPDGGSGRGAG
jgi:UPF0716 protein FxsA